MSQPDPCSQEMIAKIRNDLAEAAQLLRSASHLEPAEQETLADLLEELQTELDPAQYHSAHVANLAGIVARLGQGLHQQQHRGILSGLRSRLVEAVGRADAEAPVLAGVVRKFIDALASIGI